VPQHNQPYSHAGDEQSNCGPVCNANNERTHIDTLASTHEDANG